MESMTEHDLIQAIQEAWADRQSGDTSDYLTRQEIQERLGWPENRTLNVLRKLNRTGRLETKKKMVTTIANTRQPVPAYRVKNIDLEEDDE